MPNVRKHGGACVLLALFILTPSGISGQERWKAVHVYAGLAGGSSGFIGLGASANAELGLTGALRAVAQWTDWAALGSCRVEDAPSLCNGDAELWELGIRQGIGLSERVAPYVGGGVGLYRRRSGGENDRTTSAAVSVGAGLDIAVAPPIVFRLSATHQEVFDSRLRDRYGTGPRFTGMLVGLGLAVW